MPRLLSMLLFLLVASTVLALIHYYLWLRLGRDVGLPSGWLRALTGLIVALGVSVPLSFVLQRALPRDLSASWLRPTNIWIGVMFLLLVSVAAAELVRLGVLAYQRLQATPMDGERRLALARLLGLGAATLGFGASGFALREGAKFHIKRVEVPLSRLPPELDGTTIAQITDLHVGPSIGSDFVRQVVSQVNILRADIVAITGDLVDGTVEQLSEHTAPLAELQSRYGTYFVTGNHEYYSGVDPWCEHLTSLNMRVLRNERVSIGEGAAQFDLCGIDDYTAKQFGNGHGPDLPKALSARDTSRELVLLAHQPRAVAEASRLGVGLQISGHTHGGQLWPFSWIVRLVQPVVTGLERIGETWIYVSNGTGFWGPPMRLGAPAEVTLIVLRSPARAAQTPQRQRQRRVNPKAGLAQARPETIPRERPIHPLWWSRAC